MRPSRTRHISLPTAIAVLVAAISAVPARADATLKLANEHAACIAQAWVPFNTDPDVAPGALGEYLSTNPPAQGRLRQNEDDCRP